MWTRPESSSASKRHTRGASPPQPPSEDPRYSDPRYRDPRYGDPQGQGQGPGSQYANPAPSPSKTKGYWFGSPTDDSAPSSSSMPSPSKSKFAGYTRNRSPQNSPLGSQPPPLPSGVPDYSASSLVSRLAGYGAETKYQSPPVPGPPNTRDSPSPGRSKFVGYTSGSSPRVVASARGDGIASPTPPLPPPGTSGNASASTSTWWSPGGPPLPPKRVPTISPPSDGLRLPPPASDPWQGTSSSATAGIGNAPAGHTGGTSGAEYTGGHGGGYSGGYTGGYSGAGPDSGIRGGGGGEGLGMGRGVGVGSNAAGARGATQGAGDWGALSWAGSFLFPSQASQGIGAGSSSGVSQQHRSDVSQPPVSLGYADLVPDDGRTTKPIRVAPIRTPSPLSRGDRSWSWSRVFSPWYATTDRRKLEDGDSLAGGGSGSGRRGHFHGQSPEHTPRGPSRRDAASNAALKIAMAGVLTLGCLCSLRLYSAHLQWHQGSLPTSASGIPLAGCDRGLAYRGGAGFGSWGGGARALAEQSLGVGVGVKGRKGRGQFAYSCTVPALLAPQSCSATGAGTVGEPGAKGKGGGVGLGITASTGGGAGAGAVGKRLPPWVPRQDKFLLVMCFRGRASNRHSCLKRTLVMASLLNRTAIIPEDDVCPSATPKLSIKRLYDLAHLEKCLNGDIKDEEPKRIVLLPPGQELKVTRLFCEGNGCPGTNCVRPKVRMPEPSGFLFKQSSRAVIGLDMVERTAEQTDDIRVLALGDLFYTVVEDFDVGFGVALGPVLGADCSPLLRPPQEIYAAATIFSQVYLGKDYAALHLKRTDMRLFCSKAGCDFPSLGGAAQCVAYQMEALGLRQLFLSTDGGIPEVYYLEKLLINRGIMVAKFPFEKASATELSPVENLLVDKLLCAQAKVFVFQSSSTFALQVFDLRADMGIPRCQDRDVGPFQDPKWVDNLFSYDVVAAS